MALDRNLDTEDPTSELNSLSLFNTRCGPDALTFDFDWKHVMKRFRNTDLRLKGLVIDGTTITLEVLRAHLVSIDIPHTTVAALLAPNDKQDVVLMIKLLNAISSLPECPPGCRPTVLASRRVLRVLGKLYHHLLHAYLNISLTLDQQLTYLSTTAHLILALYHKDKGAFIPVQLYFDVMSMIKNVYFCVGKVQKDNATGEFFIVLLGTDGLEKVFGKVRTIVGGDANADQLQLTDRVDGAVQCNNILEGHPEWGGESRRLTLKPLLDDPNSISSKHDHINPRSWKGDVKVANLSLSSCWKEGRRQAEAILQGAQMDAPFARMESEGGFDILCPFGKNKMVLVDGKIDSAEEEEEEEEADTPKTPEVLEPSTALSLDALSLEPDLDDVFGTAESETFERAKYEAWVSIGNGSDKKIHKASMLRLYSSPLATIDSKDRLKRVRGYSQFNDTQTLDEMSILETNSSEPTLAIEDPAFTLVRCQNKIFLAVVQVQGIRHKNIDLDAIPTVLLHEPNVSIHCQIMKIALRDCSQQPEGPDWEWIGSFESNSSFCNVEGHRVDIVDPVIEPASRGRNVGTPTYVFRTSELRATAGYLLERVKSDVKQLPEVVASDSFPYRAEGGEFSSHKDSMIILTDS